jgi:aspartate racemase
MQNGIRHKLGIIGGTMPISTAQYYLELNNLTNRQLGGQHTAEMTLESVNFHRVWRDMGTGQWDRVGCYLGLAAANLVSSGASGIVIASNTLHHPKVLEIVQRHTRDRARVLDIVDAVGEGCRFRTVALLGTGFLIREGFYAAALQKRHGKEVVIPEPDDQEKLDQVIRLDVLSSAFAREEAGETVTRILGKLWWKQGVEAAILGCTELPLLFPDTSHVTLQGGMKILPLINSTQLHIQYAFRYMRGEGEVAR